MISLSDVVNDPDFAQNFSVIRSTGNFVAGGYQTTSVTVPFYGIITVASDEDLQMVPEGDRVTGAMLFHSSQQIYTTQIDPAANPSSPNQQYIADKIIWRGLTYRVIKISPWVDFGYWRAIGIREGGI